MRIFAVGDIHNGCYDETNRINPYSDLESSMYGYTSEERLSMMIDGILSEHKKKPVDAVLVLGDIGNNDKPFQYYHWVYEREIRGKETDRWNGSFMAYLNDMLPKSPYDCIYGARRFLDRLTAAGIPYYLITGNHDAYTHAMWRDAYGERVGEFPTHIGDFSSPDGTLSYLIELPAHDTAILMLDNFAYDEDENGECGKRYLGYLARDNITYTPISTYPKRREAFEGFIERAKGYKHLFVAAHYFSGMDVLQGKHVDDLGYVVKTGNRYGNLRAVLYGHDQCFADDVCCGIPNTCVSHWSTALGGEGYIDASGKERVLRFSIPRSPWGYSVIETDRDELFLYRIVMPVNYEFTAALADHLLAHHPEWTGDAFLTKDGKGYSASYGIHGHTSLYKPSK